MDLKLDTDKKTVVGHVVFTFWNDSTDVWDKLCMRDYSSLFTDGKTVGYDPKEVKADAAMTEITGILDGRDGSALTFERDTDVSVLWLALSKPLAPNEKMTLTYDFTAKIPNLADRYGYYDGIYNVTSFYPVLAEYVNGAWSHEKFVISGECFYSEIADFDVRITVPEGFLVASSGTESSKQTVDGTTTYTLKAPCVRSFVFCASDCFATADGTYDGVRINVYYNGKNPPADKMDECVKVTLQCAKDSLEAFGQAFGRYPYEELDIIYAPIAAGGMEYPNLIIITSEYCEPIERGPEEDPKLSYEGMEICVAHEIGHQWFMGIVGSNSGLEPWMDESLTSYTERVYEDYVGFDNGLVLPMDQYAAEILRETLLDSWIDAGHLPLNRSCYEYAKEYQYIASIYETGRRAFKLLEDSVGTETWYGILREYVRRNAFKNATAKDFLDVFYEAVPEDNTEAYMIVGKIFDLSRIPEYAGK